MQYGKKIFRDHRHIAAVKSHLFEFVHTPDIKSNLVYNFVLDYFYFFSENVVFLRNNLTTNICF